MNHTRVALKVSFAFFLFSLCILAPHAVSAATLSLSPTTNSVSVGQTFAVTIQLNTSGVATYGVDVYSLRFNPAVLQVVDADSSTAGVQIAAGTLMGITQYNTVNNSTGVIQFSQTPSTSASNFTGSGTLATITFQAVGTGSSNVAFDYTSGSTVDTNVASLLSDLLTGVTNGTYTATAVVVPPTISGVTISGLSPTNVTISWTTSTPTNGQIKYGLTTAYGSQSSIVDNIAKTTSHSVTLTSLPPLTMHHYQVVSIDASGNTATSADGTFTTLTASDTTVPPVPTGLTATAISSSQINLSWAAVVDPIVSGQVTSGMSLYKVYRSGVQVGTSAVNNFSNTGLSASTLYSYTVAAQDVAGNTSGQSSAVTATTQSGADVTPPILSSITSSSVTGTGATIAWTTSENADTQVDYGTTASYGLSTTLNTTLSTAHSAALSGLSAGVTYHYRVKSKDAAGNLATSGDGTFTTSLGVDSTAPTVSISSPSAGTVSGTINLVAAASDPSIAGAVTSGIFSTSVSVDGTVFNTVQSGSLSTTLDTTSLSNAVHTITATARDNAGNVGNSLSVSVTVFNLSAATRYPRKITLTSLEGLSSIPAGTSISASVVSPANQSVLNTATLTPDGAGAYTATFQMAFPQLVNIRVAVPGHLTRLLTNIDTTLNTASALSVPQLLAGDFNSDNIVNTLDYSSMNSHWNQNYPSADINNDTLVNSIDYAVLKNNFNKVGSRKGNNLEFKMNDKYKML